jgi:hypothetical protein
VLKITKRSTSTLYRKIVVASFETFNTVRVVIQSTTDMNRVITWLQKTHLHQMGITLLVGVAWLVSLVVWQSNLLAQAAPMTPETTYQVGQPIDQSRVRSDQADQTQSQPNGGTTTSIQNAADNIREKLNLDQPLPESTKDFFKQVQGEDVVIEEPRPSGK